MKTYLVILGSAITGLALSALMDLKTTNPPVGNTLVALIFGSAIIAGIVSMERSK
jgi:branched-subunit amino acid ABC-type transport system permease component